MTLIFFLISTFILAQNNDSVDTSSFSYQEINLLEKERQDLKREMFKYKDKTDLTRRKLEKEYGIITKKYHLLKNSLDSKTVSADNTPIEKFLSKITIQNEIDPLPDKPDPAIFQLTFPKGADDSWLIDAAIGYNFETKGQWIRDVNSEIDFKKGKKRWSFTPLFSYHRNTLVEEEQYNWQTGVSVNFANINRKPNDNVMISHYASMSLKYSRNVIDSVQSFLFTGQYDIFRSGIRGINLGTNTYTKSPFLQYFSITPSYQLQYNFMANSKAKEGSILRPQFVVNYEIGSNLERIQRDAKKKISLSLEYTGRYDVANSTGIREYYTHLFKTGLNLYLLNDPMTVTISGTFNYGSDPAKGLQNQQFWLLGLKLQKK